jgi:hypothetical protein
VLFKTRRFRVFDGDLFNGLVKAMRARENVAKKTFFIYPQSM